MPPVAAARPAPGSGSPAWSGRIGVSRTRAFWPGGVLVVQTALDFGTRGGTNFKNEGG